MYTDKEQDEYLRWIRAIKERVLNETDYIDRIFKKDIKPCYTCETYCKDECVRHKEDRDET